MRKGRRFGRLLLTTCRQPDGAPVLDGGSSTDADGRHYGVVVVSRRDGRALAVGWRDALVPDPSRWALVPRSLRSMR